MRLVTLKPGFCLVASLALLVTIASAVGCSGSNPSPNTLQSAVSPKGSAEANAVQRETPSLPTEKPSGEAEKVWCQYYCTNCGYESSKVEHPKIYWESVLKDVEGVCNQTVSVVGGKKCGGLVKGRLCKPPK